MKPCVCRIYFADKCFILFMDIYVFAVEKKSLSRLFLFGRCFFLINFPFQILFPDLTSSFSFVLSRPLLPLFFLSHPLSVVPCHVRHFILSFTSSFICSHSSPPFIPSFLFLFLHHSLSHPPPSDRSDFPPPIVSFSQSSSH